MNPRLPDKDRQRAAIVDVLERLHRHKDAAYGDAWCKRGEVIAIFANMAHKYDRLLVAFDEQRPAATEPLGDTVADLGVYAGKYLTWIAERHPAELDAAGLPVPVSVISATIGPHALAAVLGAALRTPGEAPGGTREAWARVQRAFGALERGFMAQATPGAAAADIPSYTRKAQLAWDLVQDTTWLLCYLEDDDPRSLAKLRDKVAEMDEAAAKL